MIKYVFKDDWVALKNATKADPQKLGEELEKISSQHSGRLEPRYVVEAAKNRKSPLHHHFTWDVQQAAEERWLDQARSIIRAIRVADDEGGEDKPAFISITDKSDGTAYRRVGDIADSRALQLALLVQAESELAAFRRRYAMLKDVCQHVEAASQTIKRARDEIETRAA